MISERDKERVLDLTQIEDVVGEFVKLTRRGSRYVACCPFHNEDTPSFVVTPSRNMYKCFGCGESGNAISFLIKHQNMSYPEAVKWLAERYGVSIKEEEELLTAEERNERLKKEAMLNANGGAAKFFAAALHSDTDSAKKALEYAENRWNPNFIVQEEIGFAPGRGAFMAWAKQSPYSIDLFRELGLIRNKDGRDYDAFYDRIVIPIRDKFGNVIGFTCRAIGDGKPKYVNSMESMIYNKSRSIFGIHNALRRGASEEKFYLVEGAPDVMRLHSLEIYNTIASLGSAWTSEQFSLLKKYNPTLCFIPDIDPPKDGELYGTGVNAVIKNAMIAFEAGFNVTVKEIQDAKPGEKSDPDSYITSRAVLNAIPEEDFVLWYARKLIAGKETTIEKSVAVKKIAKMLATSSDSLRVKMYAQQLAKTIDGTSKLWLGAISEAAKGESGKSKNQRSKLIDQELYQKYGFCERNNCYFSLSGEGEEKEWSNFKMEPLFHIKDQINPKRLYKITNVKHEEEIIELKQEDLVSLKSFRVRIEGLGNYLWKAKEEQLTKLKGFLYESTETAVEITQLGWQQEGFYAFGNGVQYLDEWLPVDEYGIVRLGELGNVYLPAASRLYRNERKLFQFERRFVHTQFNNVTLHDYAQKMIDAFGDNAKVGICFLLASLFHDVVTGVTKNFPMLNLFGPKGSGKSELGHSLMSFFIIDNTPPNIQNSTDAALAETVAQCSNALVHLDEYKNSIELTRREFIKGLYDGTGRTRMNMDRDKKRETTAVDCGIIISGQEMPTIDIAIFSRMLFCSFNTTEFSPDSKRSFNELVEIRKRGCSHLTLELLHHRKKFESEFGANYRIALSDMMQALEHAGIEDRILRNWVTPLAAYRTLMSVIDLPFDYKDIFKVCKDMCTGQAAECQSNNELANFWQAVDFLHQNGEIFIDADYRIKYERKFRGKGMKSDIEFKSDRPILYLCTKRVMMLYKKNAKMIGDTTLPLESLRYYLENSKEYLGTKAAMRFKNFMNTRETVEANKGAVVSGPVPATGRVDWALAFDYIALARNYGINLEIDSSDPDEPDPADINTEDTTIPFNTTS